MDGRVAHQDGGADRSRVQAWGDEQTRELVQKVTLDIPARAGVESCVVEVVRPDGHVELVTVAGDSPEDVLRDTEELRQRVRVDLDEGEPDGDDVWFRAEGPGCGELLVRAVRDEDGDLRAIVYLGPARSAEGGPAVPEQVDEALRLSLRCLLIIVEHERLAQSVRMTSVVRRLLHTPDVRHDEEALVSRAVEELGGAFDATAFEVHVFGAGWTGPMSRCLSPEECDALADAAERACSSHHVVVVEPGEVWGDDELRSIGPALDAMLDDVDARTVVLAPVGASGTALGLMLIARGWEGRRWTDAESEAVLDFGHDLGRKIVDARATHRERDLLEQLNWHEELRRSFHNTITHELKTPLTIIRANAELLAMADGLPAEAAQRLEAIERGVVRMMGMVNDLTTLARVSDPDRDQFRVTVDVGTLVQEVTNAMEAVASRAGVTLEMDEPATVCLTRGDPDQLSGALTNVVDNAVKYSDPGGHVSVSLRREGPWLVLACRDEGLGISMDDQAALFTPFFRSSNPEALARPGTGLGLDIVKGVVERHEGQVSVESELGRGTTVRLMFPAMDDRRRTPR